MHDMPKPKRDSKHNINITAVVSDKASLFKIRSSGTLWNCNN